MMGMTDGQPSYDAKKLAITQDAVKATALVDADQKQEPEQSRADLVKELVEYVIDTKKFFKDDFERIKWCQDFARGKQYDGQKSFEKEDRIRINIVQRHVKGVVSKLYAKNPTPQAKQAQKLDFAMWDETPESLQGAMTAIQGMQQAAMGAAPIQPGMEGAAADAISQAQALLADIQKGMANRAARKKLGKTLELLCKYYIRVQEPNFKRQMKQFIRRATISKVAYMKLGFQRSLHGMDDGMQTQLADASEQIAYLETLKAELTKTGNDTTECDGKLEEYRLIKQAVAKKAEIILQEGVVIDFPLTTNIIPDKNCMAFDTWAGAPRVTEQFLLTPAEVKRRYKVDLGGKFKAYSTKGTLEPQARQPSGDNSGGKAKKDARCMVWEIYDKEAGIVYPVCHGYDDFLREPAAPDITLSRFFPIYALAINQTDHDEKLFPESDVELIADPQKEINRKKEAARAHRYANRPLYVAPKGSLGEEDKHNLALHQAHEVIFLQGLKDGQDVGTMIQALKKIPMDAPLYETQSDMNDILLVGGAQESDYGPTSGATATETENAETQRQTVISSNTDDIDDFLGEFFKGVGQVCMAELSAETVTKIVGPGAMWSQFTQQQIFEDIWLETKGGSSGRPNAAQDAAKMERLAPLLMQVPGIQPAWLAAEMVEIVDDSIELSDAWTEGLPSMVAQNAMKQLATGNAATDPNQQGGQGGQNSPNNNQSTGAPQGMHPAGVPVQ